jgi:hypothetical protein
MKAKIALDHAGMSDLQLSIEITSVGLPPERHADRVIEMLREIATDSAHLVPTILAAASASSDGSPSAQRKMAMRVRKAGALDTHLVPGKRGRYQLHFFTWGGWNPDTNIIILPGDIPPAKPWLAVHMHRLQSDGRGRDAVQWKLKPVVLITHHALSRLAQRIGARTMGDDGSGHHDGQAPGGPSARLAGARESRDGRCDSGHAMGSGAGRIRRGDGAARCNPLNRLGSKL